MSLLDNELNIKEKIEEIDKANEILSAKIEDDETVNRFSTKNGINYQKADDASADNADTILKTDDVTDKFKI